MNTKFNSEGDVRPPPDDRPPAVDPNEPDEGDYQPPQSGRGLGMQGLIPSGGNGGGIVKMAVVALIVTIVIIFGIGQMGGCSFVTKEDFTTNLGNVSNSISQMQAKVNEGQAKIDESLSRIPSSVTESVNSALAETKATVATFNDKITTLTNQVNSSNQLVKANTDKVTNLTNSVTSLTNQLSSANQKITDMQTKVTNYANTLDSLNVKVTALEAKVAVLEANNSSSSSASSSSDLEDDIYIEVDVWEAGKKPTGDTQNITRAGLDVDIENDTGYDLEDIEIGIYATMDNLANDAYVSVFDYDTSRGRGGSWTITDQWHDDFTIWGRRIDLDDGDRYTVTIYVDSKAENASDGGLTRLHAWDDDAEILDFEVIE